MSSWQFESLTWRISSRLSLANHLALLGTKSAFGLPQGPPLCAHVRLLVKMDSSKEVYG